VKALLFCLLIDMRKRAQVMRAKAELLALYVQGALPR
jgi:hypothetical protein